MRKTTWLVLTAIGATALGVLFLGQPDRIYRASVQSVHSVSTQVPADWGPLSLPDETHFMQDDPQWADHQMGASGNQLAHFGCTVTSVANAVSNIQGQSLKPDVLNAALSDQGGYTERGWLIWDGVRKATNDDIRVTVFDRPSHEGLERCMAKGAYPVVKIKLNGVIQHWVLVVKRERGEYWVRDPLVQSDDGAPIALSSRGPNILSLRCVHDAEVTL